MALPELTSETLFLELEPHGRQCGVELAAWNFKF